MGAHKIIATGRNAAALQQLKKLGADVAVSLLMDPQNLETAFSEQFSRGVDIVLDYIFGRSAETLLAAAGKAAPTNRPLRYVVIGGSSGQEITLPSPILRALPL
ncbi:MAG: zinc-binding alcohol dehydrogenase family protein, partial [Firmicutes bacterium]|nr:zinc-binding alcohol dehydrogenase family protein [Bacillota bacterium]